MKYLTQTLFFFLLVTKICFAQWISQISGTTNGLRSVYFTDLNTGWAVGHLGTILRTTDGGDNWISQSNDTSQHWRSVYFTDSNIGWVVGIEIYGNNGTILKTTNGGSSWISQTSGTSNNLLSVYFINSNTGWAVGGYIFGGDGTILKTTDGGDNWISQSVNSFLNSVFFIDSNTGWVVGDNGTILKTTDGGNNWTFRSSGTTEWLSSVYFTNSNIGWAVGGSGAILKTTDGGDNWISQTSGTGYPLVSVFFINSSTGWAVGGEMYGGDGIILNTTDSGDSWATQQSGTTEWLSSVYFIDSNTGWTVGGGGTILKTNNGGVPVELTSFSATSNHNEVVLNWSTATEINNQGFEIQRSIVGDDFFTVGFVNGHGTTTEPQNYIYTDRNLDNGKYYYRLKQVDYDGSFEYSDVVVVDFRAFNSYLLEQNYPNPFNPTTTIGFGVQNKSHVKITILNAIGEEVAAVLNEEREPGFYQVEFNADNLPSGVYFYQLKAGSFVETKQMVLIK